MRHEKRTKNGQILYYPETVAGSLLFNGTPVSDLPPGAVPAFLCSRRGIAYGPEANKRELSLAQFGSSRTPSLHQLSIDFRPVSISRAEWISRGIGMMSKWCSADTGETFGTIPAGTGKLDYATESGLHGSLEGHGYWVATLAEIEQQYMNSIPAHGPDVHWCANIETSNLWDRQYYGQGRYPSWDSVKNTSILCERDGQTRTLDQLDAQGIMVAEANVRRANRVMLMLKIAKRNGALVAYGASMFQGEPDRSFNPLTGSSRFLDGASADVSNIGGINGTITLNNRTYTGMTGSFYSEETFHLDYHYYSFWEYTGSQNYDSIPDYLTLWPNVYVRHPMAREVGHFLANQNRMRAVHDGGTIPTLRMHQPFFENSRREPDAMGNTFNGGERSRTWIPPFMAYIQKLTAHFIDGERAGSGYHVFNNTGVHPPGIVYDLATNSDYGRHLHTIDALLLAVRDIESMLGNLAGSTLVTEPEVKLNGAGVFAAYNAVDAYNRDGGTNGPMKPCFLIRHKQTSEGLWFGVFGAMDQDWNTTRTDEFRIPGMGDGNTISVTYKGRAPVLFEGVFKTGTTNTVHTYQSIVSAWEKPGYAGIIN